MAPPRKLRYDDRVCRGRGAATIRDQGRFAMSSPLMRAVADGRSGCRALAAALALLVLGVAALPGRAAEDDQYSVTVKVDATQDIVGKAREAARLDGQRRALQTLADRLSGGATAAKLPKLDDKAITDIVGSFEVANERMSAVRYVADYTFHFRPAEVDRVLQKAGIGIAGEAGAAPGKPLVVLPVYQSGAMAVLWDDPNPWRDAWARRPPGTNAGTSPTTGAGTGAVQFAVPLGDAGDIAVIDAAKARAGAAAALAKIAQQNGGDGAALSRRPAGRCPCRCGDRQPGRGARCFLPPRRRRDRRRYRGRLEEGPGSGLRSAGQPDRRAADHRPR